ncbi:pyrroline-5-carboxylate reductase [Vibrio sp. CAIM 722]|uniref:Type IV secretion system putative lipoprotein virB7 n=1 Tax=Vibrio eleionomae TaxID=2653505 RepID=A0A7X4LLP8_9VIBR|nr:alpha/beta hydrolase-fold protein [Vibrio eleionomae]MZI94229.1 pyrroline-5-carboxylate reductase [Vibrio eleionomae]
MKKILLYIVIISALAGCSISNNSESKQASSIKNNINVSSNWDSSYGGVNKSYDTNLLKMREEIAPRFQTLTFADSKTGKSMTYNLYVPKNYDPDKSYPLVLFMADASTTGKGAKSPLMQGYGGIIWASSESQAKHPSFVLVPAFSGPENVTNDNWQVSDELGIALRLLKHVVSEYSIDQNRLYTTGQSMGGMISFYLNANYPDLFAASLFVGSQWDVNVLAPLAKNKFFYIVSAGDPKASKGMKQLSEMFHHSGVPFASTSFSAKLVHSEQEKQIQDLIAQGQDINFVQFDKGTVTPDGTTHGGAEHMYSFDYAYQLESVRDWLFKQTKGISNAKALYFQAKDSSNQQQAFTYMLRSAELNFGMAQYEVARDYQKGLGVRKNTSNAISWYKKAATNGVNRALLDLGILYYSGTDVNQNYPLATDYFTQASQQGDMKAPRYLGMMKEEGLGTSVSYSDAMKFYQEASERGDITAAARIGSLYERGLGVQQSYEHAIQWYLKAAPTPEIAAKNVHPRIMALVRLGYLYENGFGVKQDKDQALRWYTLASTDDNSEAKQAVKRLKK